MTDVCQGVLVTPVLNCEPGALAHFQRTLSDIDMDLTKDPDPMQIDRQRNKVAKAHDVPRKSYVPDPSDYPDTEDNPPGSDDFYRGEGPLRIYRGEGPLRNFASGSPAPASGRARTRIRRWN